MQLTVDHLKWVKRYINTVKSPSTPNIDMEDLAQEGWIAMWMALKKATESGREINEAYLKQAARWAVLTRLKDRYPDIPMDPEEMPEATYLPEEEDARGPSTSPEVVAAVNRLPQRQREYVQLRFWEGWSQRKHLTPAGYSTSLWYKPKTGAKDRLACDLSHLADAV